MGKKGWGGGGHSASLSTPSHIPPRSFLGNGKKRRISRGREYGGRFHTHEKRDKREVVSVVRKEAREVREAVGRKIPLPEGNHKIGIWSGWGDGKGKEGGMVILHPSLHLPALFTPVHTLPIFFLG